MTLIGRKQGRVGGERDGGEREKKRKREREKEKERERERGGYMISVMA